MKPIVPLLLALAITSCVPQSTLTKHQAQSDKTIEELKSEIATLTVGNNELEHENKALNRASKECENELFETRKENETLSNNVQMNEKVIDHLKQQVDALNNGNTEEIKKLLSELNNAHNGLIDRENEVLEANAEMQRQKAKLIELEKALQQQKLALTKLKESIKKSLLGFNGDELTVNEKDGKIYVSMDEKLLFKSGSYSIDNKGKEALIKIASVLEKNRDVLIQIEGHTDDVPYNGAGVIKDNWDLSAHRATSVTKILLENSNINPSRISANARGEYLPLVNETTTTARQKNRRTEIILTPNYAEVLELLN